MTLRHGHNWLLKGKGNEGETDKIQIQRGLERKRSTERDKTTKVDKYTTDHSGDNLV